MKKLTTTMMQETLNKHDGHLTVGLDLGDRSSFYCVLDGTGDVLLEQKFSTTPKAINEIFVAMPRSRIALETGTHSPWVSRLLSELGHETIVAHARSVRLIGERRRKDDRLDAMALARLVRIDPRLLCPVKHRSAEAQADLTVIRARAALVRTRTMLVNAARGLTKSYGERLRGCNARGMKLKAAQDLSPGLKYALEPMMHEIESASERICQYDQMLESMAWNRYPEAERLKQIKGVGTLIALTYMLTLEDPHRFRKSRDAACYVGLQPRRATRFVDEHAHDSATSCREQHGAEGMGRSSSQDCDEASHASSAAAFERAGACSIQGITRQQVDSAPGSYTTVAAPAARSALRRSCSSEVGGYRLASRLYKDMQPEGPARADAPVAGRCRQGNLPPICGPSPACRCGSLIPAAQRSLSR